MVCFGALRKGAQLKFQAHLQSKWVWVASGLHRSIEGVNWAVLRSNVNSVTSSGLVETQPLNQLKG